MPEQLKKDGLVCLALPEAMRQMESFSMWVNKERVNKETSDLFCGSMVRKGRSNKTFMQLQLKHYFLTPLNQIFPLFV